MKAEIIKARAFYRKMKHPINIYEFADEYAKAENKELKQFTSHKVTCSIFDNKKGICNCGLDELLK